MGDYSLYLKYKHRLDLYVRMYVYYFNVARIRLTIIILLLFPYIFDEQLQQKPKNNNTKKSDRQEAAKKRVKNEECRKERPRRLGA